MRKVYTIMVSACKASDRPQPKFNVYAVVDGRPIAKQNPKPYTRTGAKRLESNLLAHGAARVLITRA